MRNLKSKSTFISKTNIIKKYNPNTPSLRHRKILINPKKLLKIKSLSKNLKTHAGRNSTGKITVRHHGGRHKRSLRNIDWFRDNAQYSNSNFVNLEYDPNRSSNIARYITSKYQNYYILASNNTNLSIQGINNPNNQFLLDGDTAVLNQIPIGANIYNIQTKISKKPTFVRSAGSVARLLNIKDGYAAIRLPSKRIIYLEDKCIATLGTVSNTNKRLTVKGKAGANRWIGKRPTVRGYAMNPIDHPHGGKTSGGFQPKTKWGKQAKWNKTR